MLNTGGHKRKNKKSLHLSHFKRIAGEHRITEKAEENLMGQGDQPLLHQEVKPLPSYTGSQEISQAHLV